MKKKTGTILNSFLFIVLIAFMIAKVNSILEVGKIDALYFIGQHQEKLFFISAQSFTYGYVNPKTGKLLSSTVFLGDQLVRIRTNQLEADFIGQDKRLYTFKAKDNITQTLSYELDSSLKQNIVSFAKIKSDLYLLIGNKKLVLIDQFNNHETLQIAEHNQVIQDIVPFFQEDSLFAVSFKFNQPIDFNILQINKYQGRQLVAKKEHLSLNYKVYQVFLNLNTLTVVGDKFNYIYLDRLAYEKKFNGTITQYFNNEYILNDYSHFKPSSSLKFDYLETCLTNLISSPPIRATLHRSKKSYQVYYRLKVVRKLPRNVENEIMRSWASTGQTLDALYLIVQNTDNTLQGYYFKDQNPYKREQIMFPSWQIKGQNIVIVRQVQENQL